MAPLVSGIGELTEVKEDNVVLVVRQYEAVLREQASVVVGTVADEHLVVSGAWSQGADLVVSSLRVEACCHLRAKGRVSEQREISMPTYPGVEITPKFLVVSRTI